MRDHINELSQIVWGYHLLNHPTVQADCILVLCSNDTRVAEHAAHLFLQGFAPLMVFSGGVGKLTESMFKTSEAKAFSEIAIQKGVPPSAILLEEKSTNTGENILFTQKLLAHHKITPQTFIVVQKPFMERRSFATIKKHWPNQQIIINSPSITFEDYPNHVLSKDDIIHTMVGDLQRIKEYPSLGFQIKQDIPSNVWDAFKKLVQLGYTNHLIQQ